MEYNHSTFLSPFSWRYGSQAMREIFSEVHKRKLLREFWVSLAKAEKEAGLVSEEQLLDLIEHKDDIDIARASEIESVIHHDLMAEIKTYAEQCKVGGGIIHLGATSMDALDNIDIVRQKEALKKIIEHLDELILAFVEKCKEYKNTITMAFTHIQPAEITTIGYRLAQTLQDLLDDREDIVRVEKRLKGKGLKGAVGTSASYKELTNNTSLSSLDLEKLVMNNLSIEAFDAATQIYTRKQDLRVIEVLSNTASTLHKFSQDFRVLQSPPIGEFSEPFGKDQVGSSAMPFKRNPILGEKICSLSRVVESSYSVAWNNASSTFLERSLDDSANRRIFIPEAFLALDEIIITETKVVKGMKVHKAATKRLLDNYAVFASTEKLLMEIGKKGGDRQLFHEIIREESLKAWAEVQEGKPNSLKENLMTNTSILSLLTKEEIIECLDASNYTGDASFRTEIVIKRAEDALK